MLAYKASRHCGVMPLCFQARSQVSSPKLEGHNFPAFSTSTCRTRNSCEQAPAHYTSMRPSAIQSETAWASCEEAPDKLQGRGCKKGDTTHAGPQHQGGARGLARGLPSATDDQSRRHCRGPRTGMGRLPPERHSLRKGGSFCARWHRATLHRGAKAGYVAYGLLSGT